MPNVIELTNPITKSETTTEVYVKNYEGSLTAEKPFLSVALYDLKTNTLHSVLKMSDVFTQSIQDQIEKEVIKTAGYEGTQKPYDGSAKP